MRKVQNTKAICNISTYTDLSDFYIIGISFLFYSKMLI